MMKKYTYYFVIALLLLGASCSEDFLEIDHYDIVEPDVVFTSEEMVLQGLNGVYDMFYPDKNGGDIQQTWNFKPQMALANLPTLDCQAGGWDNEFTRHDWRPDRDMFEDAWKICYRAIDRANRFLVNLREVDPSIFSEGEKTREQIIAETRVIRAFFYSYLAQNFGRVPMLMEGETYSGSPNKARTETVEETWDYIIEDLEYALDILDWKPWKNEYGRVTLGMAKAYLAQAYMYKKNYEAAKAQLNDIIASGTYELEECYGTIHTEDHWWSKESVWEVAFPRFGDMSWGATNQTDAVLFTSYLTANPDYGGWGSLFISYEFCNSFEEGDKRRAYSVVESGQTNPYTGQTLSTNPTITSENMPNNSCLKMWKRRPGSDNRVYYSQSVPWKRYSAILLDYAECLFETVGEGADSRGMTGWDYINEVRNRAWGNMEVAIQQQYPNEPIPLNEEIVPVPDAKTFYSTDPHYSSYSTPAWKVALIMERRHEFLAEISFWYDLTRMGMAEEFINKEYPKGETFTNRQFDYQSYREIYPIPYLEIVTNKLIGPENQNPGY